MYPMNTCAQKPRNKQKAAVDWREIEQRLEAARVATERIWRPTVADTRRVLEQRARALARESARTESADERIEVVEFILAHERYAVASAYVREVHPLAKLTPLPCTPPFVLGIINVRGEILPVIDLKKVFGLPGHGLASFGTVIVLESGGRVFGIAADTLGGIRHLLRAGIQASLPALADNREDYLQGVTAERVIILDAGKLLSDEKLVVREQVGASPDISSM